MAESYWLRKRALYLQDQCATDEDLAPDAQERRLALFMRYQITHDRAFHTTLNTLLRLKAGKRKQEIGLESQQRAQAHEERRAAAENRRNAAEERKKDEAARSQRAEDRKEELHGWAVRLAEAKLTHQQVLTNDVELHQLLAHPAFQNTGGAQKAA